MIKFVGKNAPTYVAIPMTKNEEWRVRKYVFDLLHAKGIRFLGDLYHKNILMSFQQLQEKYKIPPELFLGTSQSAILSTQKYFFPPYTTPLSDIDLPILKGRDLKHFFSHSYSLFCFIDPSDICKIIQKWEGDLGGKYIEDDSEEAIE